MKKRLLICIQAVDLDDPLMGFFVTWLEEAAQSFEAITVLALRIGRYTLPQNVTIVPLRSESRPASRLTPVWRLIKESWLRRGAYDAVFVRGDPHYVLLAGWLWRLLGKKILFWYAHWKVSQAAVWGYRMAHITIASVKAAFDHPRITPLFIGQNVDDRRFSAPTTPHTGPVRFLAFGSVRPVKRIELAIGGFLRGGAEQAKATLTIVGPRTDRLYEVQMLEKASGHPLIKWQDGVSYDQVPTVMASFDVMINACVGSLDKVILEAMMSGLVVIASTPGMIEWLPNELHWLYAATLDEITLAVKRVLAMSAQDRWALGQELRCLAIEHHSLRNQVAKIVSLLA